MDAVELLKHDHRMVEQLFRDYEAAKSDEQRRGVVEIAIRELSKHAALEELMVYPIAKDVLSDGESTVDEQLREHMAVKKTLVALDKLSTGDKEEARLFDELRQETQHHIEEEEGTMLPRLKEKLDQETLDELGHQLDQAKQVAPTRAHPAAPTEPPELALAAPLAAAYDRLRDRLQGRPKT